jgi:hypothetical protein
MDIFDEEPGRNGYLPVVAKFALFCRILHRNVIIKMITMMIIR